MWQLRVIHSVQQANLSFFNVKGLDVHLAWNLAHKSYLRQKLYKSGLIWKWILSLEQTKTLFVKGLSEDTTEETLRESFEGSVNARIVMDRDTGSSKG